MGRGACHLSEPPCWRYSSRVAKPILPPLLWVARPRHRLRIFSSTGETDRPSTWPEISSMTTDDSPQLEHRLAAILAADVVGYSRLMAADEAATLIRLTRHMTEFVEPTIAAHRGRLFKTMGDGF